MAHSWIHNVVQFTFVLLALSTLRRGQYCFLAILEAFCVCECACMCVCAVCMCACVCATNVCICRAVCYIVCAVCVCVQKRERDKTITCFKLCLLIHHMQCVYACVGVWMCIYVMLKH